MFAPFMVNTWIAGTLVAVIAGIVGFFVVLRGSSFLAHAIPHGAFAGAAGAVLIGVDPLVGLGVFAAGGALTISLLGRRARSDVITALSLVMMLGLGALFLSLSTEYSSEVFALLFGQILGVSTIEILPMAALGAVCLATVLVAFRALLVSSALPELAAARRVNAFAMSIVFALVVACATTMCVPIVGALLMFSLLVGPSAAAQSVTRRPSTAIAASTVIALITVWASIALAYLSDGPVGFFVTAISALLYLGARLARARRRRMHQPLARGAQVM
jgi:zinc/manganese transport system permease protein